MHNFAENTLINIIAADAREIVKRVNLSELLGKSILITGASGLLGVYFLA